MADQSDKTLKILIQLGVIGENDVKAAKELVGDLNKEMGVINVTQDQANKILNNASESSNKFSMEGREMKRVLNELDAVVPGLGKSIEGLGKTITGTGGGMVVLQLAIEATKLYWDMYQESQARAAEQTATKFDRIRRVARDALAEIEDYKARLEKATRPDDAVGDKLANDRAVLAAQFAGKRKLLGAEQDQELAGAATPEEQAIIRKKYAAKATELDSQQETASLALLKSTISTLQTQKESDLAERERIKNSLDANVQERGKMMGLGLPTTGYDEEIARLTVQMRELGDRITGAQTRITHYAAEAGTAETVHGINQFSRSASQNPTITRAVMAGGFDAGKSGASLTEEQLRANMELTKLFSGMHGGQQALIAIVGHAIQKGTTQQQQIEALQNAMATLQRTGRR
jgi:hypothetical protein